MTTRSTTCRAAALGAALLLAALASCGEVADSPPPVPFADWSGVDAAVEQMIVAGDLQGAIERIEPFAGRPLPPHTELLFATALHGAKRYGAAEPHFARALAAEPPLPERAGGLHLHAWCLFQLGRLDEARARFEEHALLDPEEGDTPLGLGRIALAEGDLVGARRELERAVALHRAASESGRADRRAEGARALAFLADVELAEGNAPAARQALEASVTSYPFHLGAWSKLHEVCVELGDAAGAEKALEGRAHFEGLLNAPPDGEAQ
ncbi:tetratricopeptide repeat protein [Engelhardtia mirabilis]|uniref:Uncharacterized protein n=1 Tax=Engelhardtia mirabilis TaxID=2528011 RepID=A0A518BR23_9BACT|nr:hypothetical protein Pla133_45320 [Planctomycetes bacterium Pla133]QDV03738.1 hypothetical protein Pla86_45300 [Planctomycetes bacterium Pla86]